MIVPRGSATKLAGGRIIRRPARGFRFGPQRGTGWGRGAGLGYVSPVGFQDFASFQTAVIASFPACPPPFDPTCETPRDAQIASNLEEWKTNPQSCGVIVCDAAGNPAVSAPVPVPAPSSAVMPVKRRFGVPANAPVTSGGTKLSVPPTFGYPGYGTRTGGTAVVPAGYTSRTVPTQSASPAGAPGGPAAPPAAPVPVQTQAPPCDPTSDPTCPGYVAPTTGFSLSSIPWWGWGIGVVGLILIMRPGGRK